MATSWSTGARTADLNTGFVSMFNTTGILELRDGARPATADTTPSGTNLLASISLPASPFAAAVAGVTQKQGTWSTSSATQSGNATWGRIKLSADAGTTNTTDIRCDFNIGTAGSDLNLSTTQIVATNPVTITSASVTQPPQ